MKQNIRFVPFGFGSCFTEMANTFRFWTHYIYRWPFVILFHSLGLIFAPCFAGNYFSIHSSQLYVFSSMLECLWCISKIFIVHSKYKTESISDHREAGKKQNCRWISTKAQICFKDDFKKQSSRTLNEVLKVYVFFENIFLS